MLKLILSQANWGILGSAFGFLIGFLVKIYLINVVGVDSWGIFVSAQTFSSFFDTILSLGIPWIIIKYLPNYFEDNILEAKNLIYKILKYTVSASILFLLFSWFFSPILDSYVYNKIDNFSFILFLVSVNVPISIFTSVIIALYRSVFKIKEIVIYNTLFSVPIRAILTFFIFQYTSNIIYFILIELLVSTLILILLFYLFNKNEFSIFSAVDKKTNLDASVILYGKKMYYNSLISFFSAQSLSLIISIKLTPDQIGIYSILLTVSGVTMFIVKNINKIFAPAITKLYNENNISKLSSIYKQVTFIVNLFTLPFVILIILFANDILNLYDKSGSLIQYSSFLYILMLARIFTLISGSSGMIMIMAGLEDKELKIQIIKAVLITILAFYLINIYGLFAMIILFVLFMFYINIAQLIIIKKYLHISPFGKNLIFLILISIILMYFSINFSYNFNLLHYIIIPILLYGFYFVIFYKKIKQIYLNSFQDD
tara:strand:- start:10825 stop:12282 length:1458 start_codon:yes stop_codon:yes gene_type:complete